MRKIRIEASALDEQTQDRLRGKYRFMLDLIKRKEREFWCIKRIPSNPNLWGVYRGHEMIGFPQDHDTAKSGMMGLIDIYLTRIELQFKEDHPAIAELVSAPPVTEEYTTTSYYLYMGVLVALMALALVNLAAGQDDSNANINGWRTQEVQDHPLNPPADSKEDPYARFKGMNEQQLTVEAQKEAFHARCGTDDDDACWAWWAKTAKNGQGEQEQAAANWIKQRIIDHETEQQQRQLEEAQKAEQERREALRRQQAEIEQQRAQEAIEEEIAWRKAEYEAQQQALARQKAEEEYKDELRSQPAQEGPRQ